MLRYVTSRASKRKLRLFACACFREVWESLDLEPIREGIALAEKYADGLISLEVLSDAHDRAVLAFIKRLYEITEGNDLDRLQSYFARLARANDIPICPIILQKRYLRIADDEILNKIAPFLLREVLQSPFFRTRFDSDWRTSTATALAVQMYESRDFSAMPILADALQDAGCENADILDHCRGPGPHVRGCWVVDLVLGKS